MSIQRNTLVLLIALALLPVAAGFHLLSGQVPIQLSDFWNAWFDFDPSETTHLLVREFRFPRMIMAIVAGGALALGGMMMQTLFRNPLAGPYILGLNAGAGLAVATGLLTGFSFMKSDLGIISLALLGAVLSGLVILGFSTFLRNSVSLLLVGIMLGSFASAITSIVQTLSTGESIKSLLLWGMGSLQNVQLDQIPTILVFFLIGILAAALLIKSLNALTLGDEVALSLGINIRRSRILLIVVTALLSGLVTAFCGPIAFIGLAIPNVCRMLFKTQDHLVLLAGNLILGALFLLLCDSIVQLFESSLIIPINALTSILGAPFIVFIIVKRMA
jgi:iron complex transport system permease protein